MHQEEQGGATVQLIDVATLKHLFSERYDREMKDIFPIQDEITIKASCHADITFRRREFLHSEVAHKER